MESRKKSSLESFIESKIWENILITSQSLKIVKIFGKSWKIIFQLENEFSISHKILTSLMNESQLQKSTHILIHFLHDSQSVFSLHRDRDDTTRVLKRFRIVKKKRRKNSFFVVVELRKLLYFVVEDFIVELENVFTIFDDKLNNKTLNSCANSQKYK